jgi:hypothetical protein
MNSPMVRLGLTKSVNEGLDEGVAGCLAEALSTDYADYTDEKLSA